MGEEMEIYVEIPVRVRVTYYRAGRPGRLTGPPEDCYPDDPAEIDYEVDWDKVKAEVSQDIFSDERASVILEEYEAMLKAGWNDE